MKAKLSKRAPVHKPLEKKEESPKLNKPNKLNKLNKPIRYKKKTGDLLAHTTMAAYLRKSKKLKAKTFGAGDRCHGKLSHRPKLSTRRNSKPK